VAVIMVNDPWRLEETEGLRWSWRPRHVILAWLQLLGWLAYLQLQDTLCIFRGAREVEWGGSLNSKQDFCMLHQSVTRIFAVQRKPFQNIW